MKKNFPRKILISRGYGAGWSSWCRNSEAAQFAAEYKPIIEIIESAERNGHSPTDTELQTAVDKLVEFLEDHYNEDFYTGGLEGLEVVTVDGPYRITEYDGAESVIEQENSNLWFY